MKKIKIICIPYAGGSSAAYSLWKNNFNSYTELVFIELAGRGRRISEALYNNIYEAVNDVYDFIKYDIENNIYAFYGHSMGGLIVYELCNKIIDMGRQYPVHAFISGCSPPNIVNTNRNLSNLNDLDFINEIMHLGGTPEELFENQELASFFLPILRADLNIFENYIYSKRLGKWEFDITAFRGVEDTEAKKMEIWADFTCKNFEMFDFDGGHFFIKNKSESIINIINNKLIKYL
jgi:medium-chain acyl-[acyl-carrier-protein] hydrolase